MDAICVGGFESLLHIDDDVGQVVRTRNMSDPILAGLNHLVLLDLFASAPVRLSISMVPPGGVPCTANKAPSRRPVDSFGSTLKLANFKRTFPLGLEDDSWKCAHFRCNSDWQLANSDYWQADRYSESPAGRDQFG